MTRRTFISVFLILLCGFMVFGEEPYINRKISGDSLIERNYANGKLELEWMHSWNFIILRRTYDSGGTRFVDQVKINTKLQNEISIYAKLLDNLNNVTYADRDMFYTQIRTWVIETGKDANDFTEYDWDFRLYEIDKKEYQRMKQKDIIVEATCKLSHGGMLSMDTDGQNAIWAEKYLYIE